MADVERITGLLGGTVELANELLHELTRGTVGAEQSFSEYRATFAEMRSSLDRVFERTMRATGKPFRYGGLTILEWSGDRVSRFATYFDMQLLRVEPLLDLSDRASQGLPEAPRCWW